MIINAENLADLNRSYKTAFQRALAGVTPQYAAIATPVPSSTASNRYAWLGEWPKLREWIGDRHIKSLMAHDYTVVNKDYEGTVAVPRNAIEDDQYGVYTPMMEEMGDAAGKFPDELVFGLLAAGFTEKCYDGQYFFDTDHGVGDGEAAASSVSNMQSGGGNPWFLLDCSRKLKPLIFQERTKAGFVSKDKATDENVFMRKEFVYGVDIRCNAGFGFWQMAFASKATLDETNFDAAVDAMMAFRSNQGRPLGVKPTHLVVGPSNRKKALNLVAAEKLASGADNVNYKTVEVIVSPWLT